MALRVGIIGAGWVACARHIPAYRRHPQAELVGIFDRHPERAQAAAAKHGAAQACASVEQLLDLRPDVVSVCTPPWTHATVVRDALAAGAHVLTEKPMAMNEVDAQAMADASRAAGRILTVSHNFLFSRAVRQADRALRKLGSVAYAAGIQLSSHRRRLPAWYEQLPGGLLFDELPHMVYVLDHYIGPLTLESVRAVPRPGRSSPASCEILVRGPRATGQIVTVFDSPVSEWHVGLVAEQGVVDVDLFRQFAVPVPQDDDHGPLDVLRSSALGTWGHARGFMTSGLSLAAGRMTWGHGGLVRQFVDAALGQAPPPVTLDDAVAVVRLTDQIVAQLPAG